MASYHYAKMMIKRPDGVLFVDSGGFASLFKGAEYEKCGPFTAIRTRDGDLISPPEVLAFQEEHANIGATVDFLIPPDCPSDEAARRLQLTVDNAVWAIKHRKNPALALYASVQAWDAESAVKAVRTLASYPFAGFALGGMVPRIRRSAEIIEIVRAIRTIDSARPLHVFGIGSPELIADLFREGVDSVDSSSYVRAAADGKFLARETRLWLTLNAALPRQLSCTCRSCKALGRDYLSLEGEANRMALALHNLETLVNVIGLPSQPKCVSSVL
jgi:helicase